MLFISYSTKDRPIAAELYDRLVDRGYQLPFLDYHPEAGIPGGSRWERELQWQLKVTRGLVVLCSKNWLKSDWCRDELGAAKALEKKIIPLNLDDCTLPPTMDGRQAIQFKERNDETYARLWRALHESNLRPEDDFFWPREECPYPGLEAFQERHAGVYFGREDELDEFFHKHLEPMRATGHKRLIYVIGPSGSGKSSFVRAGVLPRLKFKTAGNWHVLTVFRWSDLQRDGQTWSERLADNVQRLYGNHSRRPEWDAKERASRYAIREDATREKSVDEQADAAARQFVWDVKDLQAIYDGELPTPVLILDQFEELLLPGTAAREPSRFLKFLKHCLAADHSPCRAIATVRSDFLPMIQRHSDLVSWNERTELARLDLLKPERLYDVVRRPAAVVGVTFDDEALVNRMVGEANRADALPLLAFTLKRFYETCGDDRVLKTQAYEQQVGGLEQCLQSVADQVLVREIGPGGRPIPYDDAAINALRQCFVRHLVRYQEGEDARGDGNFVRQTAKWSELPTAAYPLLEKMASSKFRLLTKDHPLGPAEDESTVEVTEDESTVEVTHEALFRVWPTLKEWLDQSRDGHILRNRIEQLRLRWEEKGHADQDLCPEGLVAEADDWQRIEPNWFDNAQHAYLDRSRKYHRAVADELRDRAERLEKQTAVLTKQRSRLRNVIIGLAVVIVLAAGLAWWGFAQRNEARENARRATRNLALNYIADADRARTEGDMVKPLHLYLLAAEQCDALEPLRFSARQLLAGEADHIMMTLPLEGSIFHVEFSPDGRQIVTASSDHTARVWDATTGERVRQPLRHDDYVRHAEFSPDSHRIVTASDDHTARVWDAATGEPVGPPIRHDDIVGHAEFSPDGRCIVTASEDGTARVWDAATGKLIGQPLRHDGFVGHAEFSPDGRRIITTSGDTARVWDATTGGPVGQPLRHDDIVHHAEFSPDGRQIVTASSDHTARVWDAETGEPVGQPLRHDDIVHHAEFSPDGRRIVTASLDNTARVWDATTGEPVGQLLRHESTVSHAEFSPDGRRIVTASGDTARVWGAATGKLIGQPLRHDGFVGHAEFSPDGRRIITTSGDTARVWDAATGGPVVQPLRHDDIVHHAEFSSDGRQIVTASFDGTARVWDAASGEPVGQPLRHDGFVGYAEFSSDGRQIVTASSDHTARVWDAATGKLMSQPLRHDDVVLHAEFSPDGRQIVTASSDHTARVWDAETGEPVGQPLRHDDIVHHAGFSPHGCRIVTASDDDTARVWDAATGAPVGQPLQHDRSVRHAEFSPDGRRIVTASDDRTARVWDAATGAPVGQPLRHDNSVRHAEFSADGRRIVTASWDRTARVWDAIIPASNDLAQLRRAIEFRTGCTFNPANHQLTPLNFNEWMERREALKGKRYDVRTWDDLTEAEKLELRTPPELQ